MRTILQGLAATALATCIAGTALGQTITQWNFNSTTPDGMTGTGVTTPSTGAGTLTLLGTTNTFATGSPTDPAATDNSAINTTGYPTQGTDSGVEGIRFNVATTGNSNITVTYDQRLSNTASLWWRFEYTTDGTNFVTTGLAGGGEYAYPVANTAAGTFAPTYSWDLSAIAAVNNNPNFGFRIVAIFDPGNPGNYTGANTNTPATYATTGTCRFDMVTVVQGQATGSCCSPASTVCATTTLASCSGPGQIWANGASCTPNPCSGSCCTGGNCAAPVALADCVNANTQTFTQGGSCMPDPCPKPVAVQAGDIAYGASVSALVDAVQQVRGAGSAALGATRVGTWPVAFIQFVQFDNHGGTLHSGNGNLLGLDFGAAGVTGGGVLYNLPTNGSGNVQQMYKFDATNSLGLPNSRMGGFGVSPDNQLIAMSAYDTGQIVFLEYSAGGTPGTGAGASITDGYATEPTLEFPMTAAITGGVAWIDNDTVAVMIVTSDPFGVFPPGVVAIFTMDYNSATNTVSNVTPRVVVNDTGVPAGSRFLSLAYNINVSPFLYTMSSGFAAMVSGSRIGVINVSSWSQEASMDVSLSANTGRALALYSNRYLYFSQFAGSGTTDTSPLIDRINLDANASGGITSADNALYLDNNSEDFYLKSTAITSSFNGLDIAMSGSAPVLGVCCYGASCAPNIAAAACTDAVINPGNTEKAKAAWVGSTTTCNLLGAPHDGGPRNYLTPCCKSDYNKTGSRTVQDLFDYLADWFAKTRGADINSPAPSAGASVTVQDLFDFLAAWFAGGCTQTP